MPVLLTPRHLDQRSEFYHQLGTVLQAGLGLIEGLKTQLHSSPSKAFHRQLSGLVHHLEQGATFSDAMEQCRPRQPVFDIALLRAGELSGRLDFTCRLLSYYYQERARLLRQLSGSLAYPILLFHFLVFIFPLSLLIGLVWHGEVWVYLGQKLAVLGSVYFLVLVLIHLLQKEDGKRWRSWLESILRRVPGLGRARKELALARLSISLESLVSAGITIVEAWELAAEASGSPALQRDVARWKGEALHAGVTPGEAISRSKEFPKTFTSLYGTAEQSGKLDETLRWLYEHYQEEYTRHMQAFTRRFAGLVYGGIVILVAIKVIGFYGGLFNRLNEVQNF